MNNDYKLIEALLFIQGHKGIEPRQLKDVLKCTTGQAQNALQDFKNYFNSLDRGIRVVNFNNRFKLTTVEELNESLSDFVTIEKKQRLSQAAVEVMGIIAYRQPISKSEISSIRNVSSESIVNTLVLKKLIEPVGVAQTPGKPVLFGVSDFFYDYFQIESLADLPPFEQLKANDKTNDIDLLNSQNYKNNE